MKRNIVWTIFFITVLLLSLPAVAKDRRDRDDCTCSNADLAGEWGTILTGTIFSPAGAVSLAALGRTTYDSAGNLWGTQTRSLNGTVSDVTLEGTYKVNSDCTGTKTVRSYDQSGNLLNTATMDIVLVNNAREMSEVFTSNILPNGVSIPVVITGHPMKLFPDSDREHFGR